MYGLGNADGAIDQYIIFGDMHNSNNWNRILQYPGKPLYVGDALSKNDFKPDCAERNIGIMQNRIGADFCIMGDHDNPALYETGGLSNLEAEVYTIALENFKLHKKDESKRGKRIKESAKEVIRHTKNKMNRTMIYGELPEKSREFLSGLQNILKMPLDGTKAAFMHDDYPTNKKYYDLDETSDILGIKQVLYNMERENAGIAWRGHSHTAYRAHQDENGNTVIEPINETTEEIPINKDEKTIVGIGAASTLKKLDISGGYARTYYTKKHEISFGILRFDRDTHDITVQVIVERL